MHIDDYIRAADELTARGEKATLENVRKAAGGGSYSTVVAAMRVWRARGVTPANMSESVPESLVEATRALWREACNAAAAMVAGERVALANARAELDQIHADLSGTADRLAAQVEQLSARVAELTTARDAAEKSLANKAAELKALKLLVKEGLTSAPLGAKGRRPQLASAATT